MASKDSLFSEQKQKTIANIQTKYETEKKELEIEFLNNENELITTSLSQSNTIRKNQQAIIYLLVAGFILVFVSILVIYRFYRLTKSANARLSEQNQVISRQKSEIETLLREVHHRVKNNLQIITSLLDMQMTGIDNPETKATLLDAQSRLKSIALIHQVLSQSEKREQVTFKDFVKHLTVHIKNSVRNDIPISIEINIAGQYQFNTNTIIPLGLILNELLTNAFKYAFAEKESELILINMSSNNSEEYKLEILDNGAGLPDEFDIETSDSLGLSLVHTLSKQLSGKFDYEFDGGAKFTLLFLEAK
jgi:two-component sensor histidine kinase